MSRPVSAGRRLTVLGNIPVDLSMRVSRLPSSGTDLRGQDPVVRPGGSYHVLFAARRGGLSGRFAGMHGTGMFGDLVRAELADLDCELLMLPRTDVDTGWSMGLVDQAGERTFVSAPDAVVALPEALLASLVVPAADLVYVSGYSLGLGSACRPLADWVARLPLSHQVLCDLGPWGCAADGAVLDPVLGRADWVACNAAEAGLLTGVADPGAAAAALQRRGSGGVLVRVGADGCWVGARDGALALVPAPLVTVVDTTGAGDCHSGAFLAALAGGAAPLDAAARANEAAAGLVSKLDR